MGGRTTWEVVLHGRSYYMGGRTTWEVVLHGRSYYVGGRTTWEVVLRTNGQMRGDGLARSTELDMGITATLTGWA